MGELASFWVHRVDVRTFTGAGARGPKYAATRQVDCFIERGNKLVLNAAGAEVVSTARVFADRAHAATFSPESLVVVVGTATHRVVSVQDRDPGSLDLPAHIEVALQ